MVVYSSKFEDVDKGNVVASSAGGCGCNGGGASRRRAGPEDRGGTDAEGSVNPGHR